MRSPRVRQIKSAIPMNGGGRLGQRLTMPKKPETLDDQSSSLGVAVRPPKKERNFEERKNTNSSPPFAPHHIPTPRNKRHSLASQHNTTSHIYIQSHLGRHFRKLFQSSKLEARTSCLTETRQKRRSSFEL